MFVYVVSYKWNRRMSGKPAQWTTSRDVYAGYKDAKWAAKCMEADPTAYKDVMVTPENVYPMDIHKDGWSKEE